MSFLNDQLFAKLRWQVVAPRLWRPTTLLRLALGASIFRIGAVNGNGWDKRDIHSVWNHWSNTTGHVKYQIVAIVVIIESWFFHL